MDKRTRLAFSASLLLLVLTLNGCATSSPPTPPVVVQPPTIPSRPVVQEPPNSDALWQMACEYKREWQKRLGISLLTIEKCT